MTGAKYREILDENLLQSAQDLRLSEVSPSNDRCRPYSEILTYEPLTDSAILKNAD